MVPKLFLTIFEYSSENFSFRLKAEAVMGRYCVIKVFFNKEFPVSKILKIFLMFRKGLLLIKLQGGDLRLYERDSTTDVFFEA